MKKSVQRARRLEDKQLRREVIMDAAFELLDQRRFAEIKMSDVAKAAGLAKGTVFLYFPTKEALFLELLESLLSGWLQEVDQGLDNNKGRWSAARVARIFADSLVQRERLVRLLTLVSSVLEQNVDLERMVTFKQRLLELLGATALRLERRLPFLRAGEGSRLMMRVYAIVVGVRQLTDPSEVACSALERPEMTPLKFQFDDELHSLLHAMLVGLEQLARGRA